MSTWGEQLQELREIKEAEDKKPPTPGGPSPHDILRRRYLAALHEHTERAAIVYATSWMENRPVPNVEALSVNLGDKQGFMEAVSNISGKKLALRVSGRGEGVEQCPVGSAGVEQGADAVVGEVSGPEGGAFDEVVGGFGSGVGDFGGVPVGDLGSPGSQGAVEPVDLCGHAGVLEVLGELVHGRGGLGVVDVVDAAQGFFSGAGRRGLRRGGRRRRAGPAAGRGRSR